MAGTRGQDINIYGADGNAINTVNNSLQTAMRDTLGNQVLAQDNQLGIINGYYKPPTATCEWARTPTTVLPVSINYSTNTPFIIYTPPTGHSFRLLGLVVATNQAITLATNMVLQDTSTIFFYVSGLIANTVFTYNFPGNGYKSTTANNTLSCTITTAAGTLQGTFFLTSE